MGSHCLSAYSAAHAHAPGWTEICWHAAGSQTGNDGANSCAEVLQEVVRRNLADKKVRTALVPMLRADKNETVMCKSRCNMLAYLFEIDEYFCGLPTHPACKLPYFGAFKHFSGPWQALHCGQRLMSAQSCQRPRTMQVGAAACMVLALLREDGGMWEARACMAIHQGTPAGALIPLLPSGKLPHLYLTSAKLTAGNNGSIRDCHDCFI